MIHIPEVTEENQISKMMTGKQVMNLFQISKTTLYRWVHKEKRLPYTKTGQVQNVL